MAIKYYDPLSDLSRIKISLMNLFKDTDDITYGFGEKGVLNIIFTQTQYNPDEDKLVTLEDGTQAWICDYIPISSPTPPTSNPNETADLSATISSNGNLKVGFYRTYTAKFTDKNGDAIDVDASRITWNVDSSFAVEKVEFGNKIKLKVSDDYLVGKTFKLECIVDGTVVGSIEITVFDI